MADSTGKLSQAEIDQVVAWMAKHGAADKICPVCGSNTWFVGHHLVQPLTLAINRVQFGGLGYPFVTIMSTPCGYTIFMNAVLMGLVPASQPESPNPPPP